MSSASYILQFILICLTIWRSKSIGCGFQTPCGPCPSDGKCTLNCKSSNYQCQNSHLTCKNEEDCDINCQGSFASICQGATIDASNAINVLINCEWTDSCKSATVLCGTGNSIITCDQQNSCANMVVNARNTQGNLRINCWLTNSCNGIDVECGHGDCYMNCGGSQNGQGHCTNMKLKCGTGDCRINCNDVGYRQCESISVDTTLAKSFKCDGGAIACAAAPNPFTATPTTAIPTTYTTYNPTTYQPTTKVPTKASVSVEISIIATNTTNVTIKDTFTKIVNKYLRIHLSVHSNFSLSVDVVQNNKVIVTILTRDISALNFNETKLVAYIGDELMDTDIKMVGSDMDMDTTMIYEGMNSNQSKNESDDEVMIIIFIIVIIIISLLIVLLIAGTIWYRHKHKAKNTGENNPVSSYNFILESSPRSTTTMTNTPSNAPSQMQLADQNVTNHRSNSNYLDDERESDDALYTEPADNTHTKTTQEDDETIKGNNTTKGHNS